VPQVRQSVPGPKTMGRSPTIALAESSTKLHEASAICRSPETPSPRVLSNRESPVNLKSSLLLTAASLILPVPHASAQASTPASSPTFDVVSIHQNNTATDGHHHIYNNPSESHFRTVNLSLKDLIQFAYDLPKSQILEGPSWLDSTMFDIDAKSDPSIDAELRSLPADQARRRKQLMVQALLTDRCKLTAHQETRELPVYALVIAKGGPKLKPSEINGTTISTGRSRLHVAGTDDTLALLARELAQVLGRVVLNNTGISGRYDLTLQWTPDDTLINGVPDPNQPPGIFTAIQEQLGLKLDSTKGPVPVLVLDHVETPSAN
jgi:uncharacterized protein (TIGR03435 family)